MTAASPEATARPASHRRSEPRSRRLSIDPYRVEDCTWTRSEILRARGDWPAPSTSTSTSTSTERAPRPRSRVAAPRSTR